MNEIKIIPTIFATDKKTFIDKLEKLQFSEILHIDFMDGEFTDIKSVNFEVIKAIKKYSEKYYEIHLMAYEPLKYLTKIKELGIKKVLIQEEVFKASEDIEKGIREFKEHEFEVFIVLNPTTTIDRIKPYCELIDGIMLMSVWPGREGQEFIETTYDKIKEIKDFVGEGFPIQIDGGVKDSNSKAIVGSGAQILCVGSYISGSNNPKNNYEILKKLTKS